MHEIDQTNSNSSQPKKPNRNPLSATYSLYKSLPISLQSIILGVLFCWLGVIAITVFHPTLNERWKFGADMTLNVLILLVVAVQAYIYARQWEVMQEQKRMATIGERAYLGIKNVKIVSPIMDYTIALDALMFNGGRTPAVNIRRRLRIGMVNVKDKLPFHWREHPEIETSLTILPGGAERWIIFPRVPITARQFKEFEAGKRLIHAAGEIRFTDFMGTKQIFEFDMTCEFGDNGSFKETYQRQYDNPA
jgi:hypothetical protein